MGKWLSVFLIVVSAVFFDPGLICAEIKAVRLGTNYGGWTIPLHLLHKGAVCYSVGVGEDISFDTELIRHVGCNVFLFDPTPRSIDHVVYVKDAVSRAVPAYINNSTESYLLDHSNLNKIVFYPYGLWSSDEVVTFFAPKNPKHVSYSIVNMQNTNLTFDAQCKKLSTIMKELGHTYLDLLKMDIEGAEYKVLKNMIEEQIFPQILCVELHQIEKGVQGATVEFLKLHGYTLFFKSGTTDYTFIKE